MGAHPVPAGPLAVRWLVHELEPVQAGALTRAHIAVENAGSAPWRGLKASYHWLDDRGNPIVWDGIRQDVDAAPGERVERDLQVRGPIPPGRYRLAFDLVDEHRFWLAELGNFAPELDVDVAPRDASGARLFDAGGDEERIRAAAEGARTVRPGRRTQSGVRAPARVPVPAAATRAERRGCRAARVAPRGRRAVGLRRPYHTSTSASLAQADLEVVRALPVRPFYARSG